LQLRELEHDRLEALLAPGIESDACQPEVADLMLEDLALSRSELRSLALGDREIGAIESFTLREVCLVIRQKRQSGIVSLAQLRGVHHRVEMTHRRPHSRQAVLHLLERLDERCKCRVRERLELRDSDAVLIEYRAHRGLHVLGANVGKGGQRAAGKERIVH